MKQTNDPRTPARIARTHRAIEDATRMLTGPIGGHGVLVGEREERVEYARMMSRSELARHLERRAINSPTTTAMRLLHVADAVRATPITRAPVVIATVEGHVFLQWLEAA